jgi:RNA polymerase sigma-70 factor, ECF subfamily
VAVRITMIQALRSLPRGQREALVRRYLADLPEAEVAAVLGVEQGTV